MKQKNWKAIPLSLISILAIFSLWYASNAFKHKNINEVTSSQTLKNTPNVLVNSSSSDTKAVEASKNVTLSIKDLSTLPVTSIIDTTFLGGDFMETCFYNECISNTILDRMKGYSYPDNCTISLDELRYVRVLYYGFDNETHIGELIVNKEIVTDILDIFKELYEAKYPIEKMVLVDEYNANDNLSMADNNTSSFNYRVVDGTTRLSNHSSGLAIDINPLYNPYVRTIDGKQNVLPKEGIDYVNRSGNCPYIIDKNDLCYKAFIKRGFTWGGSWDSSKDYQHFEKELLH